MPLRPPRPILPVPDSTVRVARAAFPCGNPCLLPRDRLGAVLDDAGLADLYPGRGQPAYAPWRLALVILLQFREGLSDPRAAEAVRARIDREYLLGLDLTDPGIDRGVMREFRGQLLRREAAGRLLARVLDAAREGGLLKARGRQRTDSAHVLAAVRDLKRVELLAEASRAALNAIAMAAPDWLRMLAPAAWHERYGRRIEDARLPETGPKRDAYVAQVGADGCRLLDASDGADAPPAATALPAVAVPRRVWARHFERVQDGPDAGEPGEGGARTRLRPAQGRGPGDRVESPHDTDARFRTKAGTSWTGYMVHLTETCEEGAPHLVVHVDTTPADVHGGDADRGHPRRVGRQAPPAGRAPGRRRLRQRGAPRQGPRAVRHRPGRPRAAGPELAEAGGVRVPRRRLRGGPGAPPSARPLAPTRVSRFAALGRVLIP